MSNYRGAVPKASTSREVDNPSTILTLEEERLIARTSRRSRVRRQPARYGVQNPRRPTRTLAEQAAALDKQCVVEVDKDVQAEFLKYFNLVRVKEKQWRNDVGTLLHVMGETKMSCQASARSVVIVSEDQLLLEGASVAMDCDPPVAQTPVAQTHVAQTPVDQTPVAQPPADLE